jgi:hypothetical protein
VAFGETMKDLSSCAPDFAAKANGPNGYLLLTIPPADATHQDKVNLHKKLHGSVKHRVMP